MKSNQEKDFRSQIIPNNANKCVWMELGIVSYKICDRNFECHKCPLDYGLRGTSEEYLSNFEKESQSTEENSSKEKYLSPQKQSAYWKQLSKLKLDESYHVHPGHTWVREITADLVRVGIDDMIATALGSIDEIVMPLPGEKITRGASCGQIIQFEHIFSIVSPLSGLVVSINNDLRKFPNKLVLDPINQGWILEVEPENLQRDLKYCRSGDSLIPWYLKEYKWFEYNLAEGFQQQAVNVGVTMTDGGEISRNLRNHLTKERYHRLVLNILGRTEYNK
ncbi:MAG: glycine cleavage system protein H [bacterium]|nr:glycine cleavage system protein H [bacterium]